MKFILKLFKALNSAQTPWQVTLAIALGMVAGLTPVSGIQTVLILFLAFLLNIHLGLFFVASAFFAGIGYLFDPWFEQVGYALLNSEGLRGLWTAWYNSGLMRMSHFNNTLVMGSTVVALVLAVPLYFLLGWLIDHYRDGLSVILEKYPRLGLFGILQASQTQDPLLRWWGAGLFVGVGAGVAAIALLAVDPVAKMALEAGGSTVLQRDVRVGSVDVSLAEGSVTIDRIEIAGEQEGIDALSVETAAFDIALNALLMNRTHIETVAVKGMGFDTPATLKKDPAPPSESDSEAKTGTAMELPAFELPTPESVLENADLQSLKVYNEADAEIKAIMVKWQKVSDTDLSGAALDDLKKEFGALKEMSGSKDPAQLLALQKKVSGFNKKIKEQQKALTSLQDEFNADQKRIQALYDKVLKAPMEDYNKLKSVYTLDSSGAMNVVSLLMGDKIKEYLAMAKHYYAMVEPYLQSELKPPVPPRGEGRWLKYPLTVPSPDLLIAKTEIDGTLNKQSFSANFSDITDNQKALGRPLQFKATSDGPQISGLVIKGEDNRLGAEVVDRIDFKSKGVKLDAMAFDVMKVNQSTLAFDGSVTLEDITSLSGKSMIAFSDAKLAMEGDDETAKVVGDVISSIDAFKADITLGGTIDAPEVSVSTDLDKQLSKALGKGISKQADAYSKELKGMLTAQGGDQLGALKGSAGGMVDINSLIGDQSKALGGLSGDASGLLKGKEGGGLPVKLPF
jgi:uncharacterized protein (TIGR03545 family)/uncharacterized protein (TIGR03546 family)